MDIRVTSWTELNERLYADSWQSELGRHRSNFAFRGMASAADSLRTSLARLSSQHAELEGHLLRNFRKYAYRHGVSDDSVWSWLAAAQHHGLPTRLLDWTYSPYVALHFTTAELERFGEDGAVWCVDYVKAHRLLPPELLRPLRDEGSNVFTVEMLSQAAGTLADFDRLAAEEFVLFFEPPSLDERIVNQFALVSVTSGPSVALDQWLTRHPELVRRLVIPAGLKWEVRDKLDQANITERVLFPGLDGLSRWLKRQYTPRHG